MFNLNTLTPGAVVAVDGRSGRPLEIRAEGERRRVTDVEAVRDETAAYPLQTGPRTVFVVRSHERRYRLIHLLGERRWTVEELATVDAGLTHAA
jgi:hypothetical protein